MKNLFVAISLIALIMIITQNTYAAESSAGSSAVLLNRQSPEKIDNRITILKEFLERYSSPLALYANDFIKYADEYDIDWKLVAAISGVESTFGQQIPYNSYNGWGWGVYGDNVIYFSSWKEGIETVSKGLRENYINKGAKDIYQIGRIYSESPNWPYKVSFFMEKIDEFKSQNLVNNLSVSL